MRDTFQRLPRTAVAGTHSATSSLPTLDQGILIVDDEEDVVGFIEKALTRHGYRRVKGLTDGSKALEVSRSFCPDLVLLDLHMPGVSGFEVLQDLHREIVDFEPVPVVVLTGDRGVDARMKALELGAIDYIEKPFDLEVLARLKNLLERRILGKQLHDHRRELEERVRRRTEELQEAHIETVRRLGVASEYRDDDTGSHVVRINLYTRELALATGRSEREAGMLGLAAKLHDIGKLAIPDGVLLKPGPLTAEEFEIMKTHTTIGAQILSGANTELLQRAETIALSHHERWDGAGYPRGLAGEEIPWEARLVSVCDVFDALTSKRPYKEPWPVERALQCLREGRGTQFAPEAVDVFFEQLQAILQIKERNP